MISIIKRLKNKNLLPYLGFIAFVSFIAFANTLFFEFVWDDLHQIRYNEALKSFKDIGDFFLSPIPDMPIYYRPLFMLSLLIDYKIWGDSPFGFHFTNILLSIFSNVLLFIVAERLFKSRAIAFISSIIFAIHPSHSASVSYVSARNELLCGFFIIHSFLFYITFRLASSKRLYIILSLLFYFLALLSKEMAITMPFLIVLYEYSFHKNELRKHIKLPAFFIITSIIYFLIRILIISSDQATEFPLMWRLATFSKVLLYDLFLLFFPFFHKAFYKIEIFESFSNILSIIYLGSFILLTLFVIYVKKWDRRLFFSFSWILISLIPATTIITFIYPSLIAERYLYIPSFGLAMFLGILFYDIYKIMEEKSEKKALLLKFVFGLLILVFAILTIARNLEYKDNITLWRESEKDAPYEPYVMDKLASAYIEKKYYSQAEIELKRLEAVDANNPQIHHKLGNLYKRWGKYDLAENHYLKAIKIAPDYYLAFDDLAELYKRKGEYEKALRVFFKSLEINPEDPDVLYEVGEILVRQNKPLEAAPYFEASLKINPKHHLSAVKLGDIYLAIGDIGNAKAMYEKALSISPENIEYKRKLDEITKN